MCHLSFRHIFVHYLFNYCLTCLRQCVCVLVSARECVRVCVSSLFILAPAVPYFPDYRLVVEPLRTFSKAVCRRRAMTTCDLCNLSAGKGRLSKSHMTSFVNRLKYRNHYEFPHMLYNGSFFIIRLLID
jgi:hypothetical protein